MERDLLPFVRQILRRTNEGRVEFLPRVRYYKYGRLQDSEVKYIPGVSKKKYGVADYQCFENGNAQHCDILRHVKCNFHLVVCKVSTPFVKRN